MKKHRVLHLKFCVTFVVLSCFFLAGCGKNEVETLTLTDLGKDYFPLKIGKTLTYDVDSVIYDPQPNSRIQIDTYRWQVREVFVDTFKDAMGVLNYRIERSERRRGDTGRFEIKKIFTSALTQNEALRTEDNLKFIKMPRFFGEKTTWDGNAYCDPSTIIEVTGDRIGLFSKKWNYSILTIGKAEKIGTKDFAEVTTIQAKSADILTEKRYNLEKYAKGIGLVYKEQHILDTQKFDAAVAWEKKAEKGYIVKQTLIN